MSLYSIGRKVYCPEVGEVGVISEANYGFGPGSRRTANYVVMFSHYDLLCGSADLRAVDYDCDGCGKPRAGRPHATADDGEYANGLRFCFPCAR